MTRNKIVLILLIVVTLVFGAMSIWNNSSKASDLEKKQEGILDFQSRIQELAEDAQFVFEGNKRMEEIESIFGKPKDVKVLVSLDKSEKTTEFIYDDLTYILFENEMIEQVCFLSVASEKYKMKFGLNIGVSKDYVRSILGEPYSIKNNKICYLYETEVCLDYITFYFKDNKLKKIEWELGII